MAHPLRLTVLALLVTVLGACSVRTIHPPSVSEGGVRHPTDFDHALVARYMKLGLSENDDGTFDARPAYGGLTYRPRRASIAGFDGWDVLEVSRDDSTLDDWLRITLNRDARVVVLWEDYRGWLGGWTRGPEVNGKQSFSRDVPAGEFSLGAPGPDNSGYTVLLAEAGGVPSAEPPLPEGVPPIDRPFPNEPCPTWLHQLYEARAHNGQMSESWHPQIDPVYWCYFEHEHGTDPELIGYRATFRYVADQNNLQPEQHEGFKGYGLRDEESGYGLYINVHMTTSSIARTCARHHTVVLAVVHLASGEVVAELGYKGDFGSVKTTERMNDQHLVIQPTFRAGCPDQQAIAEETDFVKMVRVHGQPGLGEGGYEHWRGGLNRTLGVDFRGSGIDIDIQNPVTACHTLACDYGVTTGSNGTRRTLRLRDATFDYSLVRILDSADGELDGVFYTNQYGDELVGPGAPNAVRQYIKPGLSITFDGSFHTEDAWRALYTRDAHTTDFELERGLGDTN